MENIDNVYVYESTDPKQIHNELAVTVYFNDDVELEKAIAFLGSYLIEMENEWTVDTWTTVQEED